jgi:hypothetical protein
MNFVSTNTRTLLVQSIAAVEGAQDKMLQRLSISLARSEQDPELSDKPDRMASLLLSFLLKQVKHIIEAGEPRDLDVDRAQHRLSGIEGRHYSRFGDALVPIFRDALGPTYPRATAAAWCDAFWGIVQRMRQGRETSDSRILAPMVADRSMRDQRVAEAR